MLAAARMRSFASLTSLPRRHHPACHGARYAEGASAAARRPAAPFPFAVRHGRQEGDRLRGNDRIPDLTKGMDRDAIQAAGLTGLADGGCGGLSGPYRRILREAAPYLAESGKRCCTGR